MRSLVMRSFVMRSLVMRSLGDEINGYEINGDEVAKNEMAGNEMWEDVKCSMFIISYWTPTAIPWANASQRYDNVISEDRRQTKSVLNETW